MENDIAGDNCAGGFPRSRCRKRDQNAFFVRRSHRIEGQRIINASVGNPYFFADRHSVQSEVSIVA